MRKKPLLVLLTLLATLGSAELLLRRCAPVTYRDEAPPGATRWYRRSEIPGLEYEHAPGAAVSLPEYEVHTNRHGMRNAEVALEKPLDVVRIAAVGDSFTFGEQVGDTQTYPFYLQVALGELRDGPERFEVLNFGVSGYSTLEEAALLEARVLEFDPDLVLLGYVLNDPAQHPAHQLHRLWHEPFWWERFEVSALVARFLADLERRRLGHGEDEFFELIHDPRAGHWETVVRGFERIRARTSAAGVPVVVVIFPLISGRDWERYMFDPLHEQVRGLAEANGFRVLDLKQALAGRVRSPESLRLEDNPHASPTGNRVFARAVAEYLTEDVLPELLD